MTKSQNAEPTCTACSTAISRNVEDERYPGLCAHCAWSKWWKDSGNEEHWNNVECIECELGRSCAVHPGLDEP